MEPYLCAPEFIGQPDLKYAVRPFQGIPGIERAVNGRLWATWYGGGVSEDRYNYVMVSSSGDDGETWTDIQLVVDPDGDGPVRAFDPCLWHDPLGRLWLFWAQGYEKQADDRSGVWAIVAENAEDGNPTWSEPVRICDGIMMNKPLVLSSGEWLLPVARWHKEGSARVCCSADQGQTWDMSGQANVPDESDRNCDEHMIVERQDGSLWMLVRTRYGIGESASADRGKTWTDVVPSEIEHTTSRFFIRRLQSGNLLLVKHGQIDEKTERSDLRAFLSEDDGQTWTGGLLLDERLRVSYPDGVQAPDGTLYVIYDFDRRGAKEILMARISEADILAGECVTAGSALRMLVNKAVGEA